MKRFGLMAVVAVFGMLVALTAGAYEWRPLGVEGAALEGGATHVLTVDYTDFATSTSSNTALELTNIVEFAAKTGVELVYAKLNAAFDTGDTNYTGSVLLTVGDSADADLFLASTELASDGTEVWFSYGRNSNYAPTLTPQTITITNVFDDITNVVKVVTNVTATLVADVRAQNLYTAANYLKLTLTPNSEEALSANTVGSFSLYFRMLPRGR